MVIKVIICSMRMLLSPEYLKAPIDLVHIKVRVQSIYLTQRMCGNNYLGES